MTRLRVWLVAAFCSLASTLAGGERLATSYVPADAWLVLQYDGSPPGLKGTTLHAFFQEPEVKEALQSLQPLVDKFIARASTDATTDLTPLFRELPGCEFLLAVMKPREGEDEDQAIVVFGLGAADSPARREVDRLLQGLVAKAQEGSLKQFQVGAIAATGLVDQDGDPHFYAFDGHFLVITEDQALLQRALDPAAAKIPPRPADERAVVRLRYDHPALLEARGGLVDADTMERLAALGLGALRTVDVALVPRGKRMAWIVDAQLAPADQRAGLVKWLAAAPAFDPAMLKMVPADAPMFLLGAMDLPALWDEIWGMVTRMNPQDADEGRRGLAEFEAKVGLSIRGAVLSHLDPGTLLVGNPGGRYVVVQRVKDGKNLDNKLLQLVNRIDLALAERREPGKVVRTELRKFTYRGTPCRYVWTMGVPALLLAGWAPCYADLGETFVFATHPLRLKRYLDFVKDGAPTILDNAQFQALRPAVPAGAAWVSYAAMTDRIARFYNTAAPFLMSLQGLAEQMELPQALDLANLPSSRVIRRYARGAITYGALEGGRYRIQGEGEGIDFLVPQVLAVDPLTMLPAMILPAYARARGEGRRIRDRNNLNQIARACAVYLNEHGDNRLYPSGLAELCEKKILTPDVLVSPLDRNPPKLPNGLPCSYVSCFERHPDRQFLDAFPPNAMMAWDRMPFVRGMRNVLFFDSHVEFVPEERFQELLRGLDEMVKQEGATRERKVPPKRF